MNASSGQDCPFDRRKAKFYEDFERIEGHKLTSQEAVNFKDFELDHQKEGV